MKNTLRWIAGGLATALISLVAHAADLAPSTFAAGTVKGDVSFKRSGSASYEKLEVGAVLPQGATVKTAKSSLAIVVFSNGATATVRPDSEVVINFTQAGFSGPLTKGEEPSVSKTQIKIVNGTVISKVAKLKKGSEYNVTSPVGAAGVRGTIFTVSYNASTGQFSVSCIEGSVVFTKSSDGSVTGVGTGKILDGDVVRDLTPAEIVAIAKAIEEIDPLPTNATVIINDAVDGAPDVSIVSES